jgi:hypothetical protein
MFKTCGYLVSTISVILLAIVAWKGAKDDPTLVGLLILGALTSVTGMGLRWISFLRDEKSRDLSAPGRADRARREAPEPSPPHRAPEEFARRASRR